MTLLLLISSAAVAGLLYVTDAFHVCRESWTDFQSLNSLVRTTGDHQVIRRSMSLIAQKMLFNIKQTFNHHVQRLECGSYEITCMIKGKTYKMKVIPHRGPIDVVRVVDENDKDISTEFIPYLLSHKTQRVSPKLFGREKVVLIFLDNSHQVFEHDDEIVLQ